MYIKLYEINIIIISYYIIPYGPYVFPKGSPFFPRIATQAAADGMMDPLVGRDEEIDRAIQILARRFKMPGSDTCEPRINKPWFINWGGIPPIVMIYMI